MDILLRCLGTSKDCKEKIVRIEDDDGDFVFIDDVDVSQKERIRIHTQQTEP